jgi:Leu/Phe-tRNA-protein transferase
MQTLQISLDYLPLKTVQNRYELQKDIYPNMLKNYYWSNDFSGEYYIAQAQMGFIAVTETIKDIELLIPEIQLSYAILDFDNLHINRKVKRLLKKENLNLIIDENLDSIAQQIDKTHKNSWVTPKYIQALKEANSLNKNFKAVAVYIKQDAQIIAGEIGYFIGKTYTSLSGFALREKKYNNYGTAQLVLLAQKLKELKINFWNLGHPHMSYKIALGAKIYTREDFLNRWFESI